MEIATQKHVNDIIKRQTELTMERNKMVEIEE